MLTTGAHSEGEINSGTTQCGLATLQQWHVIWVLLTSQAITYDGALPLRLMVQTQWQPLTG